MKIKFIDPNPEKTKRWRHLCLKYIVMLAISITLGLIFGFNWVAN